MTASLPPTPPPGQVQQMREQQDAARVAELAAWHEAHPFSGSRGMVPPGCSCTVVREARYSGYSGPEPAEWEQGMFCRVHPMESWQLEPAFDQIRGELDSLRAAETRVRELHRPMEWFECDDEGALDRSKPLGSICVECTDAEYIADAEDHTLDQGAPVMLWPCDTIHALGDRP